jgi:hypothetical protein
MLVSLSSPNISILLLSVRESSYLFVFPTYKYMLTLYGTAANAYVSGMQEDLDLYGNRLNYVNAACRLP